MNARFFYTVLFRLLLPAIFMRLWWRERRQQGYRQHWKERLGHYDVTPDAPVIWLHAVSVGETRASIALIRLLQQAYPGHRILLTHMTPTGRETASDLLGPEVLRAYLPYDLPGAINRFLDHFKPVLGALLETEIWPNLIHECARRHCPLLLVNARLSERSEERYAHFLPFVSETLAQLSFVAAQSDADMQRMQRLGAPHVMVTGNIKFDATVPPHLSETTAHLRSLVNGRRPVWLAASTRPGEEVLILNLLPELRLPGQPLLVLVPRHPQRFDEVAALLAARKISFVRRSENTPVPTHVSVLLGDSMGELQAYYSMVDVALIGGSLLPFGGQNLIEATAAGCPVLLGPHMENFSLAAEMALAAGAALRLNEARDLLELLPRLCEDENLRRRMGEAGKNFTANNQGAVQNTFNLLRRFMPRPNE